MKKQALVSFAFKLIIVQILLILYFTSCSINESRYTPTVKYNSMKTVKPIPTITFRPIITWTPVQVIMGCVITDKLNIREGPGVNYLTHGSFDKGYCITLKSRTEGWVSFYFSGTLYWLYLNSLSIEGDINSLPYITVSSPTSTKYVYLYPTKKVDNFTMCSGTTTSSGKLVTCKIPYAYCSYQPTESGKPTFCNDAPYPNHNFTLLVWGEDWSNFNGMCLLVTGIVSIYNGKSQIEATSRSQIKSCP